MKQFKVNLDRDHLSSEQIRKYQNFEKLKSGFVSSKAPFWKTSMFWGTTGLASIGVLLVASAVLFMNNEIQSESTLVANHEEQKTDELKIKDVENVNTVTLIEDGQIIVNQKVAERPVKKKESPVSKILENQNSEEESQVIPKEKQVEQTNISSESAKSPSEDMFRKKRQFTLDILPEEFPELAILAGAKLEVLENSDFDLRWFNQTWDEIEVLELKGGKYVLKFSNEKLRNKVYVRKIVS
jgi:hypothetical protein